MSGTTVLTGTAPYFFLVFFVPGAIILFVRSQLTTGRLPPPSERFLSYLIVSAIYLALTLPFVDYQPELGLSNLSSWIWIFWLFLLPAVVGLFLALFWGRIRDILIRIGLRQVHPVPNAWDWKFRNVDDQWVLVTFTDGSQVAGQLGSDSFISSDPSERDIYIQKVFKVDSQTKEWEETGAKGILITPGQVKTIEFWSYEHTREELNYENSKIRPHGDDSSSRLSTEFHTL